MTPPAAPERTCAKCGAASPAASHFCLVCGASLDGPTEPISRVPLAPNPPGGLKPPIVPPRPIEAADTANDQPPRKKG